jgi:hypothetical protein
VSDWFSDGCSGEPTKAVAGSVANIVQLILRVGVRRTLESIVFDKACFSKNDDDANQALCQDAPRRCRGAQSRVRYPRF